MSKMKKMVKSFFKPVEISEHPLHDFLFDRLKGNEEKTALVDGETGKSFTFKEVETNIRKLASGLHRLGLKNGDIVTILSPNSIEYLLTLFAVVANGAACSLLNPSYTKYELVHAMQVNRSAWIVTISSLLKIVQETIVESGSDVKGIIVLNLGGLPAPQGMISYEVLLLDDGTWFPDLQIDATKTVAIIPFSSGTTGLPKGVMLSHYNVVSMMHILGFVLANDTLHSVDEQPVMMAFLPFYHVYGLIGIAIVALLAGHQLIVLPRFHPEKMLGCVEKYQVTVLPLVPPILVYLAKSPLLKKFDISSVRRFNSGAAPLSFDTETEFRQVTGCGEIRQGYGMTETTLACLYNAPQYPTKPGSVGVILPNTEIEVIDCDTKRVLGPNENGEICVRGPQITIGYKNNKQATDDMIDRDGWLHTGDIGYYDEDGYFFIVDRIKELIKYKGFQVAPAELESLLLTHPNVADAAVIGIQDKDAGEIPKAFVVPKPGSTLSAEQIKNFVSENVASFKHLRGGVEFLTMIPKSETGKILRRVLRQNEEKRSKI